MHVAGQNSRELRLGRITQIVEACLGLLHKSLNLAGLVHDYDPVLGGVLHLGHQNGPLCSGLLVECQHLLQREVADDITAQAQAPVRPSSTEDIYSIARIAIASNREELLHSACDADTKNGSLTPQCGHLQKRIDLSSLYCTVICTAYTWLAVILCRCFICQSATWPCCHRLFQFLL